MRNQYTTIYFNGEVFNDIFNATLENDFYSDVLIGSREIIEEKIPGRDLPYFYRVDHQPLEFEVTFAFTNALPLSKIKEIVRKFLRPKNYVDFKMADSDGNFTPLYKIIFTGEPTLEHFYKPDSNGADLYVGYFTLTARCNGPYGYQEGSVLLNTLNNPIIVSDTLGDLDSQDYTITITNNSSTTPISNFKLIVEYDDLLDNGEYNPENGDTMISFSTIYAAETITIRGRLKRITSPHTYTVGQVPLYERWNKEWITISPGWNKFTATTGATVTIVYEIPKII